MWSASSVMMLIKAVTRLLHSKKEVLSLNVKIKSLNSMTLGVVWGFPKAERGNIIISDQLDRNVSVQSA